MSTPYKPTSAALLFSALELGGPVLDQESVVTVPATGPQVVLQGNPDRVGLLIINTSSINCYLGLGVGTLSAGNGILLAGVGGYWATDVRDDFTLPSRTIYCYAAFSATLYILEIIRFTQMAVTP